MVLATMSSGMARAQAPDCTGVSDVSDFDGPVVSDLDGRLATVLIPSGVTRPLLVTSPPGDTHRIFVVGQDGQISIVKDGALLGTLFLDIGSIVRSPVDMGGGDEEGLLGLAFHPNYASNGWFFVYHTTTSGNNVLARYTRSGANPDVADTATRQDVLALSHPTNNNHNGGMLAFGPMDGKLYVGTGDGGGSCDPPNNAQSLTSNLGKLLRLGVDTLPYTTTGNPFDGAIAGNNEIWAYGLRNPWRWSFDRLTGAMYIGDVGQALIEEIDCQPPGSPGGENYGWDRFEGNTCPNPSCGSQGSCAITNVLPVDQYTHSNPSGSCSVTGGYVYRGCSMGDLRGTYFYADYCSAILRSFRTDATCFASPFIDRKADLAPEGGQTLSFLTSFGEDARGELYIVSRGQGVFKIVPSLPIVELSAPNAAIFSLNGADWTWENLFANSWRPISSYKIYRASAATGPFNCLHQSATSQWAGGDPATPALGSIFYYLATAMNANGEETRPGNDSAGNPRVVNTTSVCSS
jgi:glucose/arabinose dehydrogenase